MINFKKLLIASLMVPSLASLHARGHVCSVNSELLTISGGAYISYPASLESRLEGRGGELDLYLSRANRFGIHAVGQVSYMVNGNFDLGDSYNSKEESIKGTFSKVVQGGLKNITLSGRISAGKEVIFPYEDTSYLRGKEKDCSCTRFYAGLGVSIEGNKFKSRYGNRFIEVPKADAGKKAIHAAYIAIFKNSFAIDKLNSYSVMLGIDLKLFYTVGVFMISPEVFVGPSLYGRSSYNVTYD
ncbi:MAG: hypothetical protein KAH32_05925, partial [Chlamydiia bacterium]|nr:hypothetical protein [Chlamydiia bacterium]